MATKKITAHWLDTHRPEKNETYFDSDGAAGFGVRIGKRGASFFVVYYRGRKKTRVRKAHNIGKYDPKGELGWTLAGARQEAEKIRGNVEDPHAAKKRAEAVGTFEECCRKYLETTPRVSQSKKRGELRPRTKEDYRQMIEVVLIPEFGDQALHEITTQELQNFLDDIAETNQRKATKNYTMVRSLFRRWHRKGWVVEDPAALLKRPASIEPSEPRKWTGDEVEAVLAAADLEDVSTRTLFWLEFLTGMRLKEIRNLEWSWVNFDRPKTKKNGEIIEGEYIQLPGSLTKNHQPRKVVLSRQALELLRDFRKAQGTQHAYLFPSKEGKPRATIQKARGRISKNSGVDFDFHDIRDAVGGLGGAKRGAPPHVVKLMLGHRYTEGALRYYLDDEYIPEQRKYLQRWADFIDGLYAERKVLEGAFA